MTIKLGRNTLRRLPVVGFAALALTAVGATAAVTAAETNPAEGSQLQEVIVTALRRETKLSETPISMTAVGLEDIARQRIVDFYDLQLAVPNLVFTEVTRQETFISMRGTSVDNDTPGSDPGVSVFIDGVPRTGVHDYNPELFDLESFEVLRGPQGTLFGRNATGGAILIHTTAPSFQPMYRTQLTYGSNNLAELNAIITGPVVAQTLAGKVVVAGHRRDGNINNIVTAREDGAERSASVRAQLLWVPRNDLKILFGGDYFRDTSESRVGLLDATFHPVLFPTLEYGPGVTDSAFRPQASNTIVGVSTTLDWTRTAGTLTSISGYRSVRPDIIYSALGDPYTELLAAQTVRDRQFSEELRFASNGGRRLTYLVGLFYLHLNRLDDTFYTANPVPGTVLSFLYPPGAQSSHNQEVLTESRAVFSEGTYKLLDTLDVAVGARYSSERRSGHTEITPTESSGPYEHTWNSFTPKLTLAYRPTGGLLTYATVAKGFQSGGFDASAGTSEALRTPFSPETVISYELGAKAFALDRRLSANVAMFLADYKDLQRTAFDSNPAVNAYRTTNAGKARVKGVELDTSYLAARWLKLAATYAYTDARYRQYMALQDNGTTIDYSGNTLPQTPKQQVHFSAEISVPRASTGGMLLVGADYTYRSQIQFVDANDTPQSILDNTRYDGIVNLHAGWQSSPGNITVNVFAKNVTDKRALVSFPDFTPYFTTFAEFSNPANHIYLTRYSPRRLIGISLTLRY